MRKRCYLAAAALVLGLNLAGCSGGAQGTPANAPQTAAEAQGTGGQGDLAAGSKAEGSQAGNNVSGEEKAPADKESAGGSEAADGKKDSDGVEASGGKESSGQAKASEDKETSGGAEAAVGKEGSGQTEASDEETALGKAADGENKDVASDQAETKAQETELETQAETAAPVKHSGFLFVSQGVVIGMNEDVAPILAGLGAYSNYAESPSCAFKGIDKIYSYSGFDLYTYPTNGVDYVNSVYFTDESVSTPEGIHIGSSVDEMMAAYGTGYTEEYGVYTYTNEKSTLSFIVTDGVVETVEYLAITN